ncbi:hypothetical protein B0F90DRAFT_1919059 [Multifurca ochricompacta]|uniref:C2H2-type domain-containing protein n=1 Tax=Multifurca ochricompacta TaxID=376703 RepID=A0AAD4QLF0_9AGAM|nr:hypothetical protein B0F90DRAFT_1919059 [Multifurca ochricompacta]
MEMAGDFMLNARAIILTEYYWPEFSLEQGEHQWSNLDNLADSRVGSPGTTKLIPGRAGLVSWPGSLSQVNLRAPLLPTSPATGASGKQSHQVMASPSSTMLASWKISRSQLSAVNTRMPITTTVERPIAMNHGPGRGTRVERPPSGSSRVHKQGPSRACNQDPKESNGKKYPTWWDTERSRPRTRWEFITNYRWDRVSNKSLRGPLSVGSYFGERGECRERGCSSRLMRSRAQSTADWTVGDHFLIQRRFKDRYGALLVATEADWDSRTIRELKCQPCPRAGFATWEEFKRHCDTMEAYPLHIQFCDQCGDFFARSDSLRRHKKNRPTECVKVMPDMARLKRAETTRLHDEFKVRLENCLRTGEEMRKPFGMIIKERFPGSSKKGCREQAT